MRLAINGQQMAATHDLVALLDVLDRFQVKAVELWPSNIPGGGTEEENERYERRDVAEAARLLRERGFDVACVTLGWRASQLCFGRGGSHIFAEALQGAVDAAVQLGSGLVNCYNVGVPLSLFGEAMRPAAAYAAERGVVITLENEAHDESGLPGAVAALCRQIASPGFGTQYDPCNYYHAGLEPYPAAYETVKAHIRYVHLKGGCHYDATRSGQYKGSTMRGSDRDFIGYLPLPDAAFPVEAIVRRLRRDGYEGFVTLEPHVSAAHLTAFYEIEVPYLRQLIQGENGVKQGASGWTQ